MYINQSLKFIFQSILVGLTAAIILLVIWPDIANHNTNNLSDNSAPENTGSYRFAVDSAAPAVINVYASKIYQQQTNPLFQDPLFQRFFGRLQPAPNKRRDSNLGSGVIMNPDGYVLTNAHVIQDKDEIRITLNDGRQAEARVIGIDTDTDLAVLHITLDDLPSITVGNSDALNVGDVVLAIGNPYDFGQTVTQGIVSAKGRKSMGITTFDDFIQTDADINPGNSGGALITAGGQLIGINTAIISNTGGSQGIGLATPINLAIEVMQQLIKNGRVVRGWLGIEAQILSPDILRETGLRKGGVLVAGVLNGGPADQAGIMPGDIIISVAGQSVSNPQQAIQMISRFVPGTIIDISLLRGWEPMTLRAKVAERPSFGQQS
ncbi:MAG: trypsin-like peptidase domain-containing protein [Gammaproteobacteria bacterium]|nr:trypsin-like peptidase domain-containing protein [Gammaproteobacteria bacterium]